MIPTWLKKILSEKLKDEKHEDKPVIDFILDVYKLSEEQKESVSKLEKANKELIEKRDGYEKSDKEYKAKIKELEDKTNELINGQMSDEDKKKLQQMKEKGMSPENEAKINSMQDQINKLIEDNKAKDEAARKANELNKESNKKLARESLEKELTKALYDAGIKDKERQNAALAIIEREGHAKIVEDEGEFKTSFIYTDFNGQTQNHENIATVGKFIAEKNAYLVSGSGNGGSNDNFSTGGNNFKTEITGQTVNDIRTQAAQMMDKHQT